MEPSEAPDVADLFDRPGIAAFEMAGPGDPASLHPAEARHIATAATARQQEFAAGRACARAALAALGLDHSLSIDRADDRAPIWPDGVIGSISHTRGFCLAVVAISTTTSGVVEGIGIDVEQHDRVTDRLHRRLFTAEERAWLHDLDPRSRRRAATAVFGAKEAFYKAQHPLTGSWVGFLEVAAHRSPGEHLALHRAVDSPALRSLAWPQQARSIERDGLILTAVQVRSS